MDMTMEQISDPAYRAFVRGRIVIGSENGRMIGIARQKVLQNLPGVWMDANVRIHKKQHLCVAGRSPDIARIARPAVLRDLDQLYTVVGHKRQNRNRGGIIHNDNVTR
jgi:hypothetical protein